jgi:ferrous iron transport protein B
VQRIEHAALVVGKESVGKSQLVSSLTGRSPYVSNFRGSTVACETYAAGGREFVDTPGIVRRSDSETTRAALERLEATDLVVLAAQATHLDEDLEDLLPLVRGKRGLVAVTFWDKVDAAPEARASLERLEASLGVPCVGLDARRLSNADRAAFAAGLAAARPFPPEAAFARVGWRIQPPPTLLEHPIAGPVLALGVLLVPALAAVWIANGFAELVDPLVQLLTTAPAERLRALPSPLAEMLAGRYGLVTMGPLLFVWAVPTVVLYALLLGCYKASGLVDRITSALHPLLRPFGLSGRDLARVVMGFGCNVPAVVSTRSCSSCSRGACVSAIAFGSACSYQMGATLGVFAAAGAPGLALPYLAFLVATTLVYTRLTSPRPARSRLNVLEIDGRGFLERPRAAAVWREASGTLGEFFRKALPIFFAITLVASLLDWLGAVDYGARLLGPAMWLFRLPEQSALPVLLASVRKDGILLFAEPASTGALSHAQLLTGVYLAGVLLPCLVTLVTIAREQSRRFAAALVLRQSLAAVLFAMVLAWGAALFD